MVVVDPAEVVDSAEVVVDVEAEGVKEVEVRDDASN